MQQIPRWTRSIGLAAPLLLAACNDQSLHDYHRGEYPADYKATVRSLIEDKWPEPRNFRVLALTVPVQGFFYTNVVFNSKWGGWIGCVLIEGLPDQGADFDLLNAPYVFATDLAHFELRDEPKCHDAPYQPWPDMAPDPET